MFDKISVLTIEDGGNPRLQSDIIREENGFFIRPFGEDEDGVYRFRLNVEILNTSKETIPVLFNIEWGDTREEHQRHRKYILLSTGEDDWVRIPAEIAGSAARAVVDVPTGRSYLCMQPRYEHLRFENLLNRLTEDRFKVKIIGRSRHNRNVYAIETGDPTLRPIAVMARVHPYETIGSYFVEGMLKWIKENDLKDSRIVFIPMPNPDGVALGHCKLTTGGLNFSTNGALSREPEAIAVREYLLDVRPEAIFDLHGWMYSHDNIVTNDAVKGRKLYSLLNENIELFKTPIEILFREHPTVGREKNLGGLLADKLGSVFYNSSWCWYGRTAEELFKMGEYLLKSYIKLFERGER